MGPQASERSTAAEQRQDRHRFLRCAGTKRPTKPASAREISGFIWIVVICGSLRHVDDEIMKLYTHIADQQSRSAMDKMLPSKKPHWSREGT
jgi:hypothetical protein